MVCLFLGEPWRAHIESTSDRSRWPATPHASICGLIRRASFRRYSVCYITRHDNTCTITAARRSLGNDPSTVGLASRATEAPMLHQKEQSPMIKKFTFAGAFQAAAGPLSGCAHVRQEDLAEWAGQPVDLLDKHPVFLTMRSVRTMTADGTEIRNWPFTRRRDRLRRRAGLPHDGSWFALARWCFGMTFSPCLRRRPDQLSLRHTSHRRGISRSLNLMAHTFFWPSLPMK